MEKYKVHSVEAITSEVINSFAKKFQLHEVSRLQKLKNYYLGQSDIKNRHFQDPNKPNNKLNNAYPSYITNTMVGYFLGHPVSYNFGDNEELQARVQDFLDKTHESTHNALLGKNASIFGIAYELIYLNEEGQVKLGLLDPTETFLIYDNSIEEKVLAAVRLYTVSEEGKTVQYYEVYTADSITTYKKEDNRKKALTLVDEQPHYFGFVPVIPFYNNDEAQGDFEKVIDLIDAYNIAVSDTANDIESFSDAMLFLSGVELEYDENGNPIGFYQNRNQRVIVAGQDADAKFITKGSSSVQIEEYKNRLNEDIHKFSHVPDFSDETFGNATSGESLKYKFQSLDNAVAIKERNFAKGLEQRLKVFVNFLNIKSTGSFDYNDITFQFSKNLPSNLNEKIENAVKLVGLGLVSKETIMSMLSPIVQDVAYEKELLRLEEEEGLTNYIE